MFAESSLWICQGCSHRLQNFHIQSVTHQEKVTSRLRLKSPRLQWIRRQSGGTNNLSSHHRRAEANAASHPVFESQRKIKWRLTILSGIIIGALSVFSFQETIQHSFAAARRSLRVAYALARSVRESVLPILLSSPAALELLTRCIQLSNNAQYSRGGW